MAIPTFAVPVGAAPVGASAKADVCSEGAVAGTTGTAAAGTPFTGLGREEACNVQIMTGLAISVIWISGVSCKADQGMREFLKAIQETWLEGCLGDKVLSELKSEPESCQDG